MRWPLYSGRQETPSHFAAQLDRELVVPWLLDYESVSVLPASVEHFGYEPEFFDENGCSCLRILDSETQTLQFVVDMDLVTPGAVSGELVLPLRYFLAERGVREVVLVGDGCANN